MNNTKATIYTDGAAKGNPGRGGAGVVIFERDELNRDLSEPAFQVCQFLGHHVTNNEAEYKAAILGLQTALDKGYTVVELRSDSELMVNQLNGRYVVRSEGLKPLFKEAQALMTRCESFSATHIPRNLNKLADTEANRAVELGVTEAKKK